MEERVYISLADLSRLLVDRIAPMLPAGMQGFTDGPIAGVTMSGGHFSAVDLSTGVDVVTRTVVASRTEYFLDRIQDCAIEALTHGWPAVAPAAPGSELPLAYAELDGQWLLLGYARGEVRAPLAPIDLAPGAPSPS
jgi:hypothetical protein